MTDHRVIRITVVGDGYTGKTCLLIAYQNKKYNDTYIPTVFDSYSMDVPISGVSYKIILQDTAGQEEYDRLRPLGYTDTDVFIICYCVDSKTTYENVKQKWAPEIKHFRPQAKVVLVATKADLSWHSSRPTSNFVSAEMGKKMQRIIGADYFLECSSKEFKNVNEVFNAALTAAIQNRRKPNPCVLF